MILLEMIIALIVIVLSCDAFTRGVERLGYYFGLSKHSVGRFLAAVGTALPETIVPIIAVFRGGHAGKDIGLGAALGSTFMLSTLAMFVGGMSILIAYALGRRESISLKIDLEAFKYDIEFFFLSYLVVRLVILINLEAWIGASILLLLYIGYSILIIRGEAVEAEGLPNLYGPERLRNSLLHALLGLLGIIIGAKYFVHYVEELSHSIGVSAFILSVFITPIATELPEKANSVIWYLHEKDDYALGNITGAMVFQATIPMAFVMLYARDVTRLVEELIIVNLVAALYLALIVYTKKANAYTMSVPIALYLGYALIALA